MALNRQPVPIQLGQGLDTKTDAKTVLPGKLTKLENSVFRKKDRLDKRYGNTALTNTDTSGAALASGTGLATYNDELLQYSGQKLYSYVPGLDRWTNKGSMVLLNARSQQISQTASDHQYCDSVTKNGITVYAWMEGTLFSNETVWVSVIDETSGAVILNRTQITVLTNRIKLLAFDNYIYLFGSSTSTGNCLSVVRLSTAAPASGFGAEIQVSTDFDTTVGVGAYDVLAYGSSRILWAVQRFSVPGVRAGWIDVDGNVLGGSFAPINISGLGNARDSVCVAEGPSNRFYIAFCGSANFLYVGIYTDELVQVVAPTSIWTVAVDGAFKVSALKTPDNTGVTYVWHDITAAGQRVVYKNTMSTAGTPGTAAILFRGVGMASRIFQQTIGGTATLFFTMLHDSSLQATYFVGTTGGLLVAKLQPGTGGDWEDSMPTLASVWEKSSGVLCFAMQNKSRIKLSPGSFTTALGVAKATLDFTRKGIVSAVAGKSLHIAGGFLWHYDAVSLSEHGYHLYPEGLSGSDSATGGSMSDGTYQYVAVYEWTDANGQVHLSAPSVPLTVIVNGGGSSQSTTITVRTLRLTTKTSASLRIGLYRTENAGELFYKVSATANNTAVDTINITDTATDASIIDNELLYTTGDILEHIAPPAAGHVTAYKNRLVLTDLETGSDFWFSKEIRSGEPAAFSDVLIKTVGMDSERVLASAELDDKILLFKESQPFYTYGDGPNNAGAVGEFVDPIVIPSNVAIRGIKSLVKTPDGVMVDTDKGMYLIPSGLTPAPIGQETYDYKSLTVTSGCVIPGTSEVRFTTSDGDCLVYDYIERHWATFTNHMSYDAVVWNGVHVKLKTSGAVWKEDSSTYKDAGAVILRTIETGWLSLASVVGFQRVYRVFLLGTYKSPHDITVSVAYDGKPAYTHTFTFDADGSLELAGSGNDPYRVSAHLKTQKCESIRLKVVEVLEAGTSGTHEAFDISALGLLVGVKAGLAKLRAQQSVGTG